MYQSPTVTTRLFSCMSGLAALNYSCLTFLMLYCQNNDGEVSDIVKSSFSWLQ